MHFMDKTLLRIHVNHSEQHTTLPWKEALLWFGSEQQWNSSSLYLSFLSQAQWVKPVPKPMCPPTANNGRGGVQSNYRERSQGRRSQHVKIKQAQKTTEKGTSIAFLFPRRKKIHNFCYYLEFYYSFLSRKWLWMVQSTTVNTLPNS